MEVIEPVERMRNICLDLRRQGKRIKFVPTMGSLHQGHTSLFERAANNQEEAAPSSDNCATGLSGDNDSMNNGSRAQSHLAAPNLGRRRNFVVIVSIFVNPIQFNSQNDFLNYPKSLESDVDICRRSECVDFVFVPQCHEIYKQGSRPKKVDTRQRCRVTPPETCVAQDLEGRSRPGHFEGMLTVVANLFNIIQPDEAYFGEKDYQQLLLVRQMVEDLSMKTRICPVATVREPDTMLPLSSRNVRLNKKQRQTGAIMYDILTSAKEALEQRCATKSKHHSASLPSTEIDSILLSSILANKYLNDELALEDCHGLNEHDCRSEIDYLELRCSKDLTKIKYDQTLELYDCQQGCSNDSATNSTNPRYQSNILMCRLLISVVVANVRLLDNMEAKLNL